MKKRADAARAKNYRLRQKIKMEKERRSIKCHNFDEKKSIKKEQQKKR